MRPLLLCLLLAAPSAAAVYDCSEASGRDGFSKEMAALRRDNKQLHTQVSSLRFAHEGALKCNVSEWCLGREATVKLGLDSATPVIVLQKVPSASCAEPWAEACRKGCRHVTEDLDGAGAKLVLHKAPDGTVTLEGGKASYAAKNGEGDFDGVVLEKGGQSYKAQFATRFIFRLDGSKLVDTKATLPEEALPALCAKVSSACGARSCRDAGLAKKGRRYVDARGKAWDDDAGSECRSR